MFKKIRFLMGMTGVAAAMGLLLIPRTHAQISEPELQLGHTLEASKSQVEQRLLAFTLPNEGNFQGRGITSGSVFNKGQNTEATLNFNRGRFSLSLAVPPGTGSQVNYNGTYTRLRQAGSTNSNSFILNGRVQSFASSANNLQTQKTIGSCEIEVFDARVISSSCNTPVRNSSTQFHGLEQF